MLAILAVATLVTMIFIAFANTANGCQSGKPCNNPLPTNSGKNGGPVACDVPGNGQGPVHKCPTATPTLAPSVEVTVASPKATPTVVVTVEQVEAPPVEVVVTQKPTEEATVEVTVEATVEVTPTATLPVGFPPATACGDDVVCDPCALLLQAMQEGMVVIITDGDNVTMIDGGTIQVEGSLLATGKLSETTVD